MKSHGEISKTPFKSVREAKEAEFNAQLDFWAACVSAFSCQLLTLGVLAYLSFQMCPLGFVGLFSHAPLPVGVRLLGPFILSASVRSLLEVGARGGADTVAWSGLFTLQSVASYTWMYLVSLLLLLWILEEIVSTTRHREKRTAVWRFFVENIRENGVNKKTVRFLDTAGTLFALTGLVVGLCSLFLDQYDLDFEPDGFLKDAADVLVEFQRQLKGVTLFLKNVIETLDQKFTCQEVYSALGTSAAVTLFAGFFPGAASVASVSSK